jgi:DNA repair exonuclease SbcCD nuclease subunit
VTRILFFADTHLGFDLPMRPRIVRRRRGPDFFHNYEAVLTAALQLKVDAVIHGGDLFYRSKVPQPIVEQAFAPLLALADKGLPIYLVPGNHERSSIPTTLFTRHPNLKIFTRPRTFLLPGNASRIALSGFPFVRKDIRKNFAATLEQTGWQSLEADFRLLCLHQSIQGATVGPQNYVFRGGPDVIPIRDIPLGFDLTLAGHIHRHQVLRHDLNGRKSPCAVIYPGSTERTSFAEKDDPQGFVILDLPGLHCGQKAPIQYRFHPLTTRRMIQVDISTHGHTEEQLTAYIKARLAELPPDAIVQLRVHASPAHAAHRLSHKALRAMAPPTMNVTAAMNPAFRR